MNRMVSSIYAWRSVLHQPADYTQPDPGALADRARRMLMPETRDLTGLLMGDPPAGRSALDRKRETEQPKQQEQPQERIDG